ncbi:hypothetical protein MRB53_033660 [Persea americana]|uniref:Uncharacterized protein n=1 Tax=Persea americana TaxID=3435 RepID=A0ACC2KVY8_PERAE|nr:hypothetical protein MRB53_033660 [Persea americana]
MRKLILVSREEGFPKVVKRHHFVYHNILTLKSTDIPQALAAINLSDNPNAEWFSDTRATAHITDVVDLMTKRVLASGSQHDGPYALDNQGVVAANFSYRFKRATADIWHQRLGHPQTRIVHHLHNNGSISMNKSKSFQLCSSCEMSKSVRPPFYALNNESDEPLSKVHCDLWGPAPIKYVQAKEIDSAEGNTKVKNPDFVS